MFPKPIIIDIMVIMDMGTAAVMDVAAITDVGIECYTVLMYVAHAVTQAIELAGMITMLGKMCFYNHSDLSTMMI